MIIMTIINKEFNISKFVCVNVCVAYKYLLILVLYLLLSVRALKGIKKKKKNYVFEYQFGREEGVR